MKANWAFLIGVVVAAVSARAATVERVFRPERHSRGDTNVRVQQPIDEASWIWAKGSDIWGAAVFSETRTAPEVLTKMPQSFFRFRRDFTASVEPLEFDVSADERFVLLLDGDEIARGPMRGLPNRWHYESYRVTGLEPGPIVSKPFAGRSASMRLSRRCPFAEGSSSRRTVHTTPNSLRARSHGRSLRSAAPA